MPATAATAPLSGRNLAAGAIFRPLTVFASLLALLLFAPLVASAQVGSGSLQGKVTDVETGEPLPFVNVVLFLNGNQVTGGNTDFDGDYTIKPINPGSYDVLFSFVGYTPKKVTGVKVTANKIQFVNATLGAGVMMDEAEVVEYTVPLIDRATVVHPVVRSRVRTSRSFRAVTPSQWPPRWPVWARRAPAVASPSAARGPAPHGTTSTA